MLEQLLDWDHTLFLYLNGLGATPWDGIWLFISNKFSAIPLYALLLFFYYKTFGLKKTMFLLVAVALLITVTDQLSNFFKYGVGRLRPCHNLELADSMRLVKTRCGGKFGYFSAHAANAFAVAVFFTILFKKSYKVLALGLLIWACLVAYSRIYLGVHFPLDVLTGALVGSFFAWLFSKLFIIVLQKFTV